MIYGQHNVSRTTRALRANCSIRVFTYLSVLRPRNSCKGIPVYFRWLSFVGGQNWNRFCNAFEIHAKLGEKCMVTLMVKQVARKRLGTGSSEDELDNTAIVP